MIQSVELKCEYLMYKGATTVLLVFLGGLNIYIEIYIGRMMKNLALKND